MSKGKTITMRKALYNYIQENKIDYKKLTKQEKTKLLKPAIAVYIKKDYLIVF